MTSHNSPASAAAYTTGATSRSTTAHTVLSTGIGNAAEWYDWGIYATFAPFFSKQLFNPADPTSAILSTLAVFAVGFLARPFGGLLFGWIGDRIGRKTSMTLSIGVAAVGSLLIAVAPTFQAVGALASLVLLVARLVQGLAHGGELPSSQTYLSETAPRERRGLWSTLIYFSGTIGTIVGVLMGAVFTIVLTPAQMGAFGWRIPFLVGALLGLWGLVMRARLKETEVFQEEEAEVKAAHTKPKLWPEIVRHRKQALQVIGLTVGLTIVYYVWAIVAPTYAATTLKIDAGQALWAGVAANIVFLIALPLWGKLSDRIGRKPILLISAVGAAALNFPMVKQGWMFNGYAMLMALVSALVVLTIPETKGKDLNY